MVLVTEDGLNYTLNPELLLWYSDNYKEESMDFRLLLKTLDELLPGSVCSRIEYDREKDQLVLRAVYETTWYAIWLDDEDLQKHAVTLAEELVQHLNK